MSLEDLSRRQFLQSAGAITGAAYVRMLAPGLVAITQAACSARDADAAFTVLGADEARDFAAIAARIIPTTDTPGATEAGVIHFMDQALAAEMGGELEPARSGLAEFNRVLNEAHPNQRFDELDEDAQDSFLESHQSTGFFNLMWTMTIYGFFAMPGHGGNRNKVGWELIGFEGDHGPWQYPFGYYDAEVHGEKSDGG